MLKLRNNNEANEMNLKLQAIILLLAMMLCSGCSPELVGTYQARKAAETRAKHQQQLDEAGLDKCFVRVVPDSAGVSSFRIEVQCFGSAVTNLAALKGMFIDSLVLDNTHVTELSFLHGMALKELALLENPITNLSALAGMKLESFSFTFGDVTNDLEIVRKMNSLKRINGIAPVDFWKRFDNGEAKSPEFGLVPMAP